MNMRFCRSYLRGWLPGLLILIFSASPGRSQAPVAGPTAGNGDATAKSAAAAPKAPADDSIQPTVAVIDYIDAMANSPLAYRPEINSTGSEFGNNVVTTGAGDLFDLGEGEFVKDLSKLTSAASGFSKIISDVPVSEGSALLGSIAGKDPVGSVVNVGKVGIAVIVGIGVEKLSEGAILAYGSWAIIPVTLGGLAVGAIAKSLLDLGGAEVEAYLSRTPTEVELKRGKIQASINRCESDFKNGWLSEAQRNKWVGTQKESLKQLEAMKQEADDFQKGVLAPIEASLKAIKDAAEKDRARLTELEDQRATSRNNEESAPDEFARQLAHSVTIKLQAEIAQAREDLKYNDRLRSEAWETIEPELKKALVTFQALKKRLHEVIYRPMGVYYLGYKLAIVGPATCTEGDVITLTLTLVDPPEIGIHLPPYDFECRVDDDDQWNILKDGTDDNGLKIKREGKQLTIVTSAGSSDTTLHFQVIEKSQAAPSVVPRIAEPTADISGDTKFPLIYAWNSIAIHSKPKDKPTVVQPTLPKSATPPPQPQVYLDYVNAKKAYDQARKQMPPPSNIRELFDDYQKKYKAYTDWAQNPGS